jgi:hypothetical protein
MFKAIKEFFLGKPVVVPQEPVAPYKVEAPAFRPTADAAPIEETPAPVTKPVAKAKKSSGQRAAKKPAAKKPTPTPN